ncbi:MAG: SsrA-binding protein SmpB [Planctomycetota bacterium]|nr:SsrA-binding protein SmpB [Planctomycetota bacterium]
MSAKKDKQARAQGAAAEPARVVLATNRKARYHYVIEATVEAGLVLRGSEVKSLRTQNPTIAEGYARVKGDAVWLESVTIHPLPQASYQNHEPTRSRKCLLHRREITKIKHQLEAKGATLIPLQVYFKGHRVKVELGLGRGRNKGDRRQHEKDKHARREIRETQR